MRIEMNNCFYDIVSRVSRYYIPLAASIYILLSWVLKLDNLETVLTLFVLVDLIIGFTLLMVRLKWKAKDTLIIDDRDPEEVSFGLESGRLFEELHHNKVLTIRIRKLGMETRDEFDAHSDH